MFLYLKETVMKKTILGILFWGNHSLSSVCILLVSYPEICFVISYQTHTHTHMHACVHNSTEAVFRLGHNSYKKIQISVFAFLGWMKDNYI